MKHTQRGSTIVGFILGAVTGTVAGQSVTLKCTSELKSEDGEDTEVGRMCDISGPAGVVLQVHIDLSLMHTNAS